MSETSPAAPAPFPSQPGVGSPFTTEIWAEIADLRRLDRALDDQIVQAEYGFVRAAVASATDPLVMVYQRLEPLLTPAPHVIFTFSWLKRGGAEWVGVQLVREAQRRYGAEAVLVLVLDWDVDEAQDWLPAGSRFCILMREAPELSREQRSALLLHYLAAISPRLVVNCNSGITWDLYRDHGSKLAQRMSIAAFAFCFDYTDDGVPIGYLASHLPQTIHHLSVVISDNTGFRGDLGHAFGLPQSWLNKVVAVAQPVELPPAPDFKPRDRQNGRPVVAWASRLCRQKRPELLLELARLRPEIDFVVYGDLYEPDRYSFEQFERPNIRYAGSFRTLRDLPVQTFDAFLYTALYDGLPNIVLAAGALGIPVVSAIVGGIGEVVDVETGWPVHDHAAPGAYATALDAAFADPSKTVARARRLYDRIAATHSEATYRDRIEAIGLFPPASP